MRYEERVAASIVAHFLKLGIKPRDAKEARRFDELVRLFEGLTGNCAQNDRVDYGKVNRGKKERRLVVVRSMRARRGIVVHFPWRLQRTDTGRRTISGEASDGRSPDNADNEG